MSPISLFIAKYIDKVSMYSFIRSSILEPVKHSLQANILSSYFIIVDKAANQSPSDSDEGLTLEMAAFQICYDDNNIRPSSNHLMKTNFHVPQ